MADRHAVVLAESYPSAAYEAAGIVFRRNESKRRQADRMSKASAIFLQADRASVDLAEDVRNMIAEGFGPSKSGEDPFDALAGLLMMIAVAEGKLDEAPTRKAASQWEGWILGV